MFKPIKSKILIVSLIAFLPGCQYDSLVNTCVNSLTQVPFERLLPIDGSELCFLQNLNENPGGPNGPGRPPLQLDLIIQTQDDYEKYFSCIDSLQKIDFTKKTLLAGRYIGASSSFILDQNVFKDCDQNYYFNIQLRPGRSDAFSKIHYYAIIPKITSTAKVVVKIFQKKSCENDSVQITSEPLVTGNHVCGLQNIDDTEGSLGGSLGFAYIIVINTKAEFESQVICSDPLPAIDFDKNTLLASVFHSANDFPVAHQDVFLDCNGNYLLNVQIPKNTIVFPAVTNLYFFAVVPKISVSVQARLSVSYN